MGNNHGNKQQKLNFMEVKNVKYHIINRKKTH